MYKTLPILFAADKPGLSICKISIQQDSINDTPRVGIHQQQENLIRKITIVQYCSQGSNAADMGVDLATGVRLQKPVVVPLHFFALQMIKRQSKIRTV